MANLSNTTPLPGDNRSPLVRLTDDIASLARMASITFGMVEKAICPSRSVTHDKEGDIYTFNFSGDWTDQLHFAAADVMDRARSILARIDLIGEPEAAPAEPSGSFDRYELLSSIEGSLSVLSGLADAIDELSALKNDPAKRLSGVSAIVSPLDHEIGNAKTALNALYNQHFAAKSTG